MEDEPHTPTHRRRSSSVVYAAGSKHKRAVSGHDFLHSTSDDRIPEESSSTVSSSDVEMDDWRSDDEVVDDEETGLTQAQRRKRRRRKVKNTMLDERIAGGETDMQKVEEQIVAANLLRTNLINALLIGLWYGFSISISVYNKWMFSKENLDFHFPLFTTSVHMLVQFSLASLVLYFIPRFRPRAGMLDPHAQGYTQVDGQEEATDSAKPADKPLMTRWFYFTRIGPCGTATALDVGLGNFSLRFISLTFFTMCKSSVLAFVLLFALIFRLEKPSWKLGLIILIMTAGVVMMVAGETAFNVGGFVLVMSASFCSGFRWSLTQILLLRNPATSNPFSSIFFLTPVMFVALLILALPIEGPSDLVEGFKGLTEAKGTFMGIFVMLFPGFLAFMMVASEFALLKRTSVVTLSVCGIFKEVLTISVASVVFGDKLSPINISGLVVTIASIAAYNYLKFMKMRQDARKEVQEILEEDGPSVFKIDGEDEADDNRHGSTGVLIRNSLSVATNSDGDVGHSGKGHGYTQSPTKRPEDLD